MLLLCLLLWQLWERRRQRQQQQQHTKKRKKRKKRKKSRRRGEKTMTAVKCSLREVVQQEQCQKSSWTTSQPWSRQPWRRERRKGGVAPPPLWILPQTLQRQLQPLPLRRQVQSLWPALWHGEPRRHSACSPTKQSQDTHPLGPEHRSKETSGGLTPRSSRRQGCQTCSEHCCQRLLLRLRLRLLHRRCRLQTQTASAAVPPRTRRRWLRLGSAETRSSARSSAERRP
jgi:hypothetical protein